MLLHDAGSRHAKMGEIWYTQGKLDEALESYRACLAVMNEVLDARPESATARRSVGITLQWLGIVSAARGERDAAVEYFGRSIAMLGALLREDAALPAKERAAHWRTARDWLLRCRGVFVEMRERGTLAPADKCVPEELAAEIVGCDAAIEELTREASLSEKRVPAQPPQ
jgi:tetratricopeptide (TPR) repeat protein